MVGTNRELVSLSSLFDAQKCYQYLVTALETPLDSTKWFMYHSLAMQEEMGELLTADKRWKTHRNEKFVQGEKLEELADVFITAINLSIFSGFDADMLVEAIACKINQNKKKFLTELKNTDE